MSIHTLYKNVNISRVYVLTCICISAEERQEEVLRMESIKTNELLNKAGRSIRLVNTANFSRKIYGF